jgi:hypothetical protein
MRVVGIQIKSSEAILVVLNMENDGTVLQTSQSVKFGISESQDSIQVRQFRDQVNATLDSIKPDKIVLLARQHRGMKAASPLSFKLEGIIQLYEKSPIEFIAPQTVQAYKKKYTIDIDPKQKQQRDAFDAAYIVIKK